MERGHEESSSRGGGQREHLVLGYFFHLRLYRQTMSWHNNTPRHRFIPSSPKGRDLKNGKWGALDESLAFVGQPVQLIASYNGVLLCNTSNSGGEGEGEGEGVMQYYVICNPVTREFRLLPPLIQCDRRAVCALICKGGDSGTSSAELSDFEIIRARAPPYVTKQLHLDIFSSTTGEWRSSCVECRLSFSLQMGQPGVVLEGVIYWKTTTGLIAYDRSNESVEPIKLPSGAGRQNPEHQGIRLYSMCSCNGKLYYVCSSKHHMEVWMMQNYCHTNRRAKWNLKHTISFSTMFQQNPDLDRRYAVPLGHAVCGMHPYIPRLVMVSIRALLCWYDIETGKLKVICKNICSESYNIFPYEWPSTTF